MTTEQVPPELFHRYLRLLGVLRRDPSHAALCEVVSAHLCRVPFENISKLLYREREGLRSLPGLERFLTGIERYHFGGTCYANNYYMHLLLAHLGYDVSLCGADMSAPDVHIVNIVRLEGREYLIDAGYAAPFLEPLPRDLDRDHVVALGRDRHVLKPRDKAGRSRLELHREGRPRHGYQVNPIPRSIDHFTPAISSSFTDGATFMNSLLLVRFLPGRSITIHNLSVIDSRGEESRWSRLPGRDQLPAVIEDRFAIPRGIAAEALASLGTLGDAWT